MTTQGEPTLGETILKWMERDGVDLADWQRDLVCRIDWSPDAGSVIDAG